MPSPEERQEANLKFQLARIAAIERYSELEQSLCRLFGVVLKIEPDYAAVIFFKITSARGRTSIIEKLLRKRLGKEYVSAFWNPVFKALNLIDQKRNEIVHWTTLVSIGDAVGVSLVPPNIYDLLADQPAQPWDIARLGAYSDECSFYLRLINMFGFWTFSEMKVADIDAQRKTWLDIFQQAPVYPPPDNHPLSPNYVEP